MKTALALWHSPWTPWILAIVFVFVWTLLTAADNVRRMMKLEGELKQRIDRANEQINTANALVVEASRYHNDAREEYRKALSCRLDAAIDTHTSRPH